MGRTSSFFAVVFASIVLFGCVTNNAPKLVQNTDPYTKKSGFAFGPINANICPDAPADGANVYVSFIGTEVGTPLYVMSIELVAHEWYFLEKTLPLDILIDGAPFKLDAIDSRRDVQYANQISEYVRYPVTKSFADKLANAKSVKFRVHGSRRSIERCLGAEQLSQIKTVVPLISK